MTNDEIRTAVSQVLRSGCFFVAPAGDVQVEYHAPDSCPWEIFRGHLLSRSQTRLEKTLESWSVNIRHHAPSLSGPILSVKFSALEQAIFVTRNILMFGWEPSAAAANVVATQETQKWTAELVATISLVGVPGEADLRRQLSRCIFLAVVGASRLPITSLESPLPGFSLGQFAYVALRDVPGDRPLSSPRELISQGLLTSLSLVERAKLLEMVLRAARPSEVPALAEAFLERWQAVGWSCDDIPLLMRTLFNHLALSPYTEFVENLAALLAHLARPGLLGSGCIIDLISYMLRHTVRHLTGFDLVTFHNSGANYPDLLMIETLLKAYLELIERNLHQFEDLGNEDERRRRVKRCRRRAMRQAWLIRSQYEGLRVPDAPTSPGENLRVLPEPFMRVPEEQIRQPGMRRRILFANNPAHELLTERSGRVLRQSIQDLQRPEELRELGMAIHLDRPLGILKHPGEVDRTPLLSYESFSLGLAERRLKDLVQAGLIATDGQYQLFLKRLHRDLGVRGFPVTELSEPERPGVVALEDARRVSSDFLFLRITRQSLTDFLAGYNFEPLRARDHDLVDWLFAAKDILLIRSCGIEAARSGGPFLTVFNKAMKPRVWLGFGQDASTPIRYQEVDGLEYLEQGLRVLSVTRDHGGTTPRNFRDSDLRLLPSFAKNNRLNLLSQSGAL